MNTDFYNKHPELARRLVYAHTLSVKYMYEHPYNAAMMFADGFDADPYVALRTIYMKTVAEGRTITWQWEEKNMENEEAFSRQFPGVLEEDILTVDLMKESLEKSAALYESAGVPDFTEFIKEKIDPICPIGTTFEDWYNVAKTIDGVSDEKAVDITKTATPYLNENVKDKEDK